MIPLSYSCRNLLVRWKTTLMTASAFVLVGVFEREEAVVSGPRPTTGDRAAIIALFTRKPA